MNSEPNPTADAELVALGNALDAAWAKERELADRYVDHEDGADDAVRDAGTRTIVEAIEALHATTFDGVLAKAKAVAWCRVGDEMEAEPHDATDQRLIAGLVNDLFRLNRSMPGAAAAA